jgi:hypothetical protein
MSGDNPRGEYLKMLDKQGIMPEEDEFDAEDRRRKEIEKRNNGLLDIFADDLRSQNLSGKLIEDHIFNAHTYINLFLMTGPESPYTMEQGVSRLDEYFGYFFIRKCMWSNAKNLPENTESVRLFYKSMMEHDVIDAGAYEIVQATITEKMDEWAADMRKWNE